MLNKYTREIIINIFCNKYQMRQAIKIAIVVGTILNIINQGDYIFHMAFEKINFYKLVLTYFLLFFVSAYTAVSISMMLKIGDRAMATTNIACNNCQSSSHIDKNEIIPECPKCGVTGRWKAIEKINEGTKNVKTN